MNNDFRFIGNNDSFYPYKETCAIVQHYGVIPEKNPPERVLEPIQRLIDRCMIYYEPVPGELQLKGLFYYKEYEQAGDLKNTFGFTLDIGNGEAIIGLSDSLLQYSEMSVFHDLVFLHELCHLSEMNHGEKFQDRFNEVEFNYYFYHNVRADSVATPKPKKRKWRM